MLTDLISFTGHLVLGACSSQYNNILHDDAICLFAMDGKCPHGMLRMDSDEEYRKACANTKTKHVYCCLITSIVHRIDLKVTKV